MRTIFGYPGGAALPLYRELANHPGLRHVLVRHEENAALAADGYARATGFPGVCLATSGPGATNLLTGIATAMMDSVPLLALTGQVATPRSAPRRSRRSTSSGWRGRSSRPRSRLRSAERDAGGWSPRRSASCARVGLARC